MDRLRRYKIQKKTIRRRKTYSVIILLVLFFCVFPPLRNAETPPIGTHLTILNVTTTPDPITEMDTLRIYVTIQNIGSHNITAGEPITISISIDNEKPVIASLTDTLGLVKNRQRTENLTWIAEVGSSQSRTLHITVAYLGVTEAITETSLRINERKTDLLFISTPTISGMSNIGRPITITALVKNIGRNTTQDINVSLSIDRRLSNWFINTDDIVKGESFTVSFSWTPLTFGIHRINLTIDPKQTITEETRSNNYYETTTSVIPWWNSSWHYRRVYNITGTGNISLAMNFTSLLSSLQVMNKTFENTTITIVRYYTNGTMAVVNKTWFNESSSYHNRTNARGTLSFVVPASSLYAVYFDVHENRGNRRPVIETINLTRAGTVSGSVVSTEGWWPEFLQPFETYYLPNSILPINVSTTSLARNVTAYFSYNGTLQFTLPLKTEDNLGWSDVVRNLSKKGTWTMQVIGYDDAGYHGASLTTGFYIGQPDLSVSALALQTVYYVGINSTVTAYIRALNTTVNHVNVTLRIDNNDTMTQKDLTIQKDENRTVQFFWTPSRKGTHNVSVVITYTDSDPGNNSKWKKVVVEAVPDLGILNMSVSPVPVDEGNPVMVIVTINNTGEGNATNYKVILYCEQNLYNNTMYFNDEKNSTTVTLKRNERKNVTLTWAQTRYGKPSFNGEWAIGVQILNTTQTPDSNDANNYRTLFHVLRVIPSERNPPVFSNLECPIELELGNQVLIRVRATDESGIGSVILYIKTPKQTYVNATMTSIGNNRYEYLYNPTQLGRYNVTIIATDLSPNRNQSTITRSFEVTGDKTPPTVTYYGVNPPIQLRNDPVEIRCITTDFSGISSVQVLLLFPNNLSETYTMSHTPSDTKYTYTHSYSALGEYTFWVTVEDTKGNKKTTEGKAFWITDDFDDTDSDGMPDAWEAQYGLDPYDPRDASQDLDSDGTSNLEEYTAGTNPTKKMSSPSEILDRLQENWMYLVGSIAACVIIVMLAYYGIRRRKL
jgi:hypothetical protein